MCDVVLEYIEDGEHKAIEFNIEEIPEKGDSLQLYDFTGDGVEKWFLIVGRVYGIHAKTWERPEHYQIIRLLGVPIPTPSKKTTREILGNQEALGEGFEEVLNENRWDLYESDSKTE